MKINYELNFEFERREIYYYDEAGQMCVDTNRDERCLEEPLEKGKFDAAYYVFRNPYYKIRIDIEEKYLISKSWKPGDEVILKNTKEPFMHLGILSRQDSVPFVTVSYYKKGDENYEKEDFVNEFYIANAGFFNEKHYLLRDIEKIFPEKSPHYYALKVARFARSLFEEFFPGWSLR